MNWLEPILFLKFVIHAVNWLQKEDPWLNPQLLFNLLVSEENEIHFFMAEIIHILARWNDPNPSSDVIDIARQNGANNCAKSIQTRRLA